MNEDVAWRVGEAKIGSKHESIQRTHVYNGAGFREAVIFVLFA
jgi:hypothetical protein